MNAVHLTQTAGKIPMTSRALPWYASRYPEDCGPAHFTARPAQH